MQGKTLASKFLFKEPSLTGNRLFKGIHPAGTLENNLLSSQKIGVLDDEGELTFLEIHLSN